MAKYVEGDWNGFEFHMIQPADDLTRILEHIQKNFYLRTPLLECLTYSKEFFDEFDNVYKTIIPQGLSFYCLDKATNEIAGARITYIQDREVDSQIAGFGFKTQQMLIMNRVMGTVNSEANMYERYGIDSFVNFYTACVDPKFQGRGIATEMYNRALAMVRANKNYVYVKSNLTSPYTRRICNKFGFTELARAYYVDFKDEDGQPLLKGKKEDECVAFMVLKL